MYIYPPDPIMNVPIPIRRISFLHLSGLLNVNVIREMRSEGWIRIFVGMMTFQLSWTTLPGLRGLACSEFHATLTSAPDNERGVAIECSSEAERDSLLAELEVTHRSLNDDTIEGVRHRNYAAYSVQYHPEASAGPHDSHYLFARFRELMS